MEKLEMELIKRLQNTQAIQKEAYLELEKALSQPSAMLNTSALKQNLIQGAKKWTCGVYLSKLGPSQSQLVC